MPHRNVLRRLEVLEQHYRSREQREIRSLRAACICIWKIVLAYYLGDLKSDEDDPLDAEARALKYPSQDDYFQAGLTAINNNDTRAISEIVERYNDAFLRLFAKVGLDFDNTPRNVLFDALVTMINQLPEKWLNRLRSDLRRWCPNAEIAVGSNLPRRLFGNNIFLWNAGRGPT